MPGSGLGGPPPHRTPGSAPRGQRHEWSRVLPRRLMPGSGACHCGADLIDPDGAHSAPPMDQAAAGPRCVHPSAPWKSSGPRRPSAGTAWRPARPPPSASWTGHGSEGPTDEQGEGQAANPCSAPGRRGTIRRGSREGPGTTRLGRPGLQVQQGECEKGPAKQTDYVDHALGVPPPKRGRSTDGVVEALAPQGRTVHQAAQRRRGVDTHPSPVTKPGPEPSRSAAPWLPCPACQSLGANSPLSSAARTASRRPWTPSLR